MAARKKRGAAASGRKTKSSPASSGGRRTKRARKGAASTRGGSATARKTASRKRKGSNAAPPQPDIQEESGATVYRGRSDTAQPGVTDPNERINAEDHSSPRSRLHDGAESVVNTPEEAATIDDRTGKTPSAADAEGPGASGRTSDERSGTSGPAGAYFDDGGNPVDERPRP